MRNKYRRNPGWRKNIIFLGVKVQHGFRPVSRKRAILPRFQFRVTKKFLTIPTVSYYQILRQFLIKTPTADLVFFLFSPASSMGQPVYRQSSVHQVPIPCLTTFYSKNYAIFMAGTGTGTQSKDTVSVPQYNFRPLKNV